MKALLAFAVLLLSASCFELSDTMSVDEMTELFDDLTAEPEVSEFARGQWEVLGLPGIVGCVKKGPPSDPKKHYKDLAYVKTNMKSFEAAVALVKYGLGHHTTSTPNEEHKKYVCSYFYIPNYNIGHAVVCFKRSKFGDHTRMYKYKAGAFFTGGYML